MSFPLLKARAARAAQSEAAVQVQIAEAIPSSRAARIKRLEQVVIPEEERRQKEEEDKTKLIEKELGDLATEEKSSDGSRQTLDDFASRQREITFRLGQAKDAAAHHKNALESFRAELGALQEAEKHDQDAADLAALEAHGVELVSQLVGIYKSYIVALAEYDAIEAAIIAERFLPFGRGEAQARLRSVRERAARAIGNDRTLARRPEIRL